MENNKDKCKVIYKDKEYELQEEFKIENKNENTLKIKIKGINNITDMSNMFNECSSLLSLSDTSNWSTNNVTNMSSMFNRCS